MEETFRQGIKEVTSRFDSHENEDAKRFGSADQRFENIEKRLEPSNQVLAIMINNKTDSMSDTLKRIENQTIATNGRVSKLEELKNKVLGGLIFANLILVPAVVALLIKLFNKS